MPEGINKRAEKLAKVLNGKNNINILFTQPDPDAIASAIAFGYLLDQAFHISTRVFYCGRVSDSQNKFIVNKFNLGRMMKPLAKMPKSVASAPLALVDSSSMEDSRLEGLKIEPLIIIDHHRNENLTEETEDNFIWVEDTGSASTLVVELLSHFKVQLVDTDQWLATLLALGIYTDTKGLVSANNRDRIAYGLMADIASYSEIVELVNYPIPERFVKHMQRALETKTNDGPRVVAGIGMLDDPDDGDHISRIADYLIRVEGTTLALVWGIVDDKVRVSARSRDASFPLDEYMKKEFGEGAGAKIAPDGHGEGGALIEFKLGIWHSPSTQKDIESIVHKRLCEIVFKIKPSIK